ncbi:MAG: radical SAM protein, partial [Treponema sp.]|nr:radical SAM protein [Treponema sp.]
MTPFLYIHIPFCKKKCDYCDFFSIPEVLRRGKVNDLTDEYVTALVKESEIYSEFYNISFWKSLYLGGGTPSLLSPGQIKKLIAGIKKAAPFSENAEITLEMNPDDVNEEFILACGECG